MKTPGERLRYIRSEILGLPYNVIAKRHNLDRHQIYNWESGRIKVSHKVLDKYLPCLEKEGIRVDAAWIMQGAGNQPFKMSALDTIKQAAYSIVPGTIPELALMVKDVSNFNFNHTNPICVFVESDFMQPFYGKGDYVCGDLVYTPEGITALVGCNCIVFIKKMGHLVRKIKSVNADNTFNLIGSTGVAESMLQNIEIDSAAEIILHRKFKER